MTKPATIVLTQETAVKYFGNEDPIEYTFLDQDFDNLMRADQKPGDLFTLFSMLAIAIACLGLGGLASFVTVQRTKEIGVRKVLGACITRVATVDFEGIYSPGWGSPGRRNADHLFYHESLLQDFHYRIDIDLLIFPMAGERALFIALLTISYQARKAALADPAKSLRDE